jgi:hypothetical protein
MKPIVALIICISLTLFGCHKHHYQQTKLVSPAGLIFGSFYGECATNCVNIYSVDRSNLYKDTGMKYPDINSSYAFKPVITLDHTRFIVAQELLSGIPPELLRDTSITFGAPDSHDQGGLYVEIWNNNMRSRFMIDNDNTTDQSAELIEYKQRIANALAMIR